MSPTIAKSKTGLISKVILGMHCGANGLVGQVKAPPTFTLRISSWMPRNSELQSVSKKIRVTPIQNAAFTDNRSVEDKKALWPKPGEQVVKLNAVELLEEGRQRAINAIGFDGDELSTGGLTMVQGGV